MPTYKTASKAQLIEMNDHAIKAGFNRTIDKDFLRRQPDTLVAISFLNLPHSSAGGRRTDPHMRSVFLVHHPDHPDPIHPVQVTLDCDWDAWEKLPQIKTEEVSTHA